MAVKKRTLKNVTKKARYVAVVGADRPSFGTPHGKHFVPGEWSCFVGPDKDEVVQRALKARGEWGTRDYEVWIGTLTEKVVIPTNFKLVAI